MAATHHDASAKPGLLIFVARFWPAHVLLLTLSLTLIAACGSTAPIDAARPNVVLIVVDALRAANVSFLGYARTTTPHLDALAAKSYVFDQAVSVGGNTPTAMSALMTGRYPFIGFGDDWTPPFVFGMRRFYVDGLEPGLPRSLPTLAEQLSSAGYTTAGFITNPYLKRVFDFHRGFDEYEEIFREQGVPYGQGETVSHAAVDFLRTRAPRPFFLYLHYMDTHGPYSPPDAFRTRFGDEVIPLEDFAHHWQRWEKLTRTGDPELEALAAPMLNLYDGAIAYVDDCIAQVLDTLEELELADDTVVIVTADHGEEFLEHGGTTHQGTLYDELLRIPLLIHLPGKEGGRLSDLVRNFDSMPTILQLAGIDTEGQELDAVSLLPLIEGSVKSLRLNVYAGFPHVRMLRTPRYKLLRYHNDRREFYDLSSDPAELHNLYPADAAASSAAPFSRSLAGMEKRLAQLEASFQSEPLASGPAEMDVDPATLEQLRALGYLD